MGEVADEPTSMPAHKVAGESAGTAGTVQAARSKVLEWLMFHRIVKKGREVRGGLLRTLVEKRVANVDRRRLITRIAARRFCRFGNLPRHVR